MIGVAFGFWWALVVSLIVGFLDDRREHVSAQAAYYRSLASAHAPRWRGIEHEDGLGPPYGPADWLWLRAREGPRTVVGGRTDLEIVENLVRSVGGR